MTDYISDLLGAAPVPRMEGQVCRKCHKWKPWLDFDIDRGFANGRNCRCKTCCLAQKKETRQRRKDAGSGIEMRERLELMGATKRCPQCKRELPYSAFGKQQDRSDGTAWCCFECQRRRYRKSIKRQMFYSAKERARKMGLPFDITIDDIIIPDICPIMLIPIAAIGDKIWHKQSPSLDRIIPQLGYVRGNVAVISWLANRLKGECEDPEAFRRLADYIESAQAKMTS